jgi:hypothetical protein
MSISFTLTRNDTNIEAQLSAQVQLGGTAIVNYDYTATGFDQIVGTIGTVLFPANQNQAQVVLTAIPGLTQPSKTVRVEVLGNPPLVQIDPTHPFAVGTLAFTGGGGGYGYGG